MSTMYNLIPVVREFDIIAGVIKTDKNKADCGFSSFECLFLTPITVFKTHLVEIFKIADLAKEWLLLPVCTFIWTVDKCKYPLPAVRDWEMLQSLDTLFLQMVYRKPPEN